MKLIKFQSMRNDEVREPRRWTTFIIDGVPEAEKVEFPGPFSGLSMPGVYSIK